jgi:hypothetical protein
MHQYGDVADARVIFLGRRVVMTRATHSGRPRCRHIVEWLTRKKTLLLQILRQAMQAAVRAFLESSRQPTQVSTEPSQLRARVPACLLQLTRLRNQRIVMISRETQPD